jgi:hypothetical protein
VIKAPPTRVKRLRRCLNPQCEVRIAKGKMPLRSTWTREYVQLICPKCRAISVFNPVAKVAADASRHTYVARDGREAVEHILPKSKVLVPEGVLRAR